MQLISLRGVYFTSFYISFKMSFFSPLGAYFKEFFFTSAYHHTVSFYTSSLVCFVCVTCFMCIIPFLKRILCNDSILVAFKINSVSLCYANEDM